MASFLYVFPHPDDECFGPAPAIARQVREGHDVHLLTLTRGEATSQRERLGVSKDEMGRIRYEEMQNVADALGLASLTVLDYPDGALDALDPRIFEATIGSHVREREPDVLVTYAVHGISGHYDHLVTHAAVRRTACALRNRGLPTPSRLALFTIPETVEDRPDHLNVSAMDRIDGMVTFTDEDLERARTGLHCYETYLPVIEKHRPLDSVGEGVAFELYGESHAPPLDDLTTGLDLIDPWWSDNPVDDARGLDV